MNLAKLIIVVIISLFALPEILLAVDKTPLGYYYPMGSSTMDHACGNWLERDPNHGGCYFSGEYHIGLDIMADVNDPVYAIADGVITHRSVNGWGSGNSGIVIRHSTPDGHEFLALYGHVKTSMQIGETVSAGLSFATIGYWSNGNHLHFAIHPGLTMPSTWGRLPNSSWPSTNGFTDPMAFMEGHVTAFNFNALFGIWEPRNSVYNSRIENDALHFESWKDPNILGPAFPFGVDTDQFRTVELAMGIKQAPEFNSSYFNSDDVFLYYDLGGGITSDEQRISLGKIYPTDGSVTKYTAEFNFSGPIKQLRLDPVESNDGKYAEVSLKYLRFVSSYYYWYFSSLNPMGWSLEHAYSAGFESDALCEGFPPWGECSENGGSSSAQWIIEPLFGTPQATSPWLGEITTSAYNSLNLRYAVHRDLDPNGEKLNAEVCFDIHDDGIDDFSQQSPCYSYKVTPDSIQHEYNIPLPCTGLGHCQKIYRVRIQFYQGSDDQKYKVTLDDIKFMSQYVADFETDYCSASSIQSLAVSKSTFTSKASSIFLAAAASSPGSYITIQKLQNIQVSDNTPIDIRATAAGSCGDCYNWSLIENPLDLSISDDGHIHGNSGNEAGVYSFVVRAEDQDYPGNYTEADFSIAVGDELTTNSLRIFSDGVGPLQVTSLALENNSDWLEIQSPYDLPFTIEGGSSENIYVSVNKQLLSSGTYTETIVITSNDDNDSPINVPVSVTITGDADAPPAPENLNITPETWFSNGNVQVNWTNPSDPSGISGYRYKVGSPPTSDSDGTFSTDKPLLISPSEPGSTTLFIWLEDGAGNSNYRNLASTTYFFDSIVPSIISRYPNSNSVDVPVDSEITVQIEEDHSGISSESVVMEVNGVEVDPIITSSSGNNYITYNPSINFNYGETVTVSIGLADQSTPANTLAEASWSFVTETVMTAPTLYSFAINNNADSTSLSLVTLDHGTSGAPTEYKVSEREDLADVNWQPYSDAPSFTLSAGFGTKTVYFQVRNVDGESSILSDTIEFINSNHICESLNITANIGTEIYTPPSNQTYAYRYGPSILKNGNVIHWWAAAEGPGMPMDLVRYRRGILDTNGDFSWSTPEWVSALEATPDSADQCSVCDPSVISFGGYYYMAYTSTEDCTGGGKSGNQVFLARCSDIPNGDTACEKWSGASGWGNDPQPIISWTSDGWGIGQPSLLIIGDTLYIYYTSSGTKLIQVDVSDENWPEQVDSANAVTIFAKEEVGENFQTRFVGESSDIILSGSPGPLGVKYNSEYQKFVGIVTLDEFSTNSNIVMLESNDGIHFTPVSQSLVDWDSSLIYDYAHNIGISGDYQGHIDFNEDNFIAYGYGERLTPSWSTYMNPIDVEVNQNKCISVGFAADQTTGVAPFVVNFMDLSTGPVSSWAWDFDNDGTFDSTEQNPTHTYNNPGAYSVTLEVSDGINEPSVSNRDNYITVSSDTSDPKLELTPTNTFVSSNSGIISFSVSNTGGGMLNWTASTDEDWITIDAGEIGINTGEITLSYTSNTGTARTGIITVTAPGAMYSPKNLYINQAAVGSSTYSHSYSVPCEGYTIVGDQWLPINQGLDFEQGQTVGVLTNLKDISVNHRFGIKYYVNDVINSDWMEVGWRQVDSIWSDSNYWVILEQSMAYGVHRVEIYLDTGDGPELLDVVSFDVHRTSSLFSPDFTVDFNSGENPFILNDYSENLSGEMGLESTGGANNSQCLFVNNSIVLNESEAWRVHGSLAGLALVDDTNYVLSIWMKAENTSPVTLSLSHGTEPFIGLVSGAGKVIVGPEWSEHKFLLHSNIPGNIYLENIEFHIDAGEVNGKLWIDDFSLITNATSALPYFQDFEHGFNYFIKEDHNQNAGELEISQNQGIGGSNSLTLYNSGMALNDWEVQIKKVGFDLKNDTVYKLSFMMKSDNEGDFVAALNQNSDIENDGVWQDFGLYRVDQVGTEWKNYIYSFNTTNFPENQKENVRLSLSVGKVAGNIFLDNIFIQQDGQPGLLADLNGDSAVNLMDAILAMQVVSGVNLPPETEVTISDIDGDCKVGIAEAVYILQETAGDN